jgi:hypothetical protein
MDKGCLHAKYDIWPWFMVKRELVWFEVKGLCKVFKINNLTQTCLGSPQGTRTEH